MLRFSYNTIGCSNHTLSDALELISEAGYQGVTLTLDVHHMNPFEDGYERAAEALRSTLEAADLAKLLEEKCGVSAAAPVAAVSGRFHEHLHVGRFALFGASGRQAQGR